MSAWKRSETRLLCYQKRVEGMEAVMRAVLLLRHLRCPHHLQKEMEGTVVIERVDLLLLRHLLLHLRYWKTELNYSHLEEQDDEKKMV